jgi:FHA domain
MYTCPKNHNSTEADFCSECGAKIMGLAIAELVSNPTNKSTSVVAPSISIQSCPDCSTPHEADSGNFCEICGYNFLTNAKGSDLLSTFPPPIQLSSSNNTAPTQLPITTVNDPISAPKVMEKWQLIILIDPTLATADSPIAPMQAPITIQLNQGANLIGRTSQARAIHPEIPLDLDDAISSRHAILTINPGGALVLRDIGSSNGTMLNGKEIAMMVDISISAGDEITLGHWTRIKLVQLI